MSITEHKHVSDAGSVQSGGLKCLPGLGAAALGRRKKRPRSLPRAMR
jgi:hypothetical protein